MLSSEWSQQVKIGAIALPIRHKGNILACINVVFLKKAMKIPEAAERYLPELKSAVQKIETLLSERDALAPDQ